MAIFNSYVKLAEGNDPETAKVFGFMNDQN